MSSGTTQSVRSAGALPTPALAQRVSSPRQPARSFSRVAGLPSSSQPPDSRRSTSTSAYATPTPASSASAPLTRPDLSRRTADPIPPQGSKTTKLQRLSDGLWLLQQDLWLLLDINLNTCIARLGNGELIFISPPARTEEAAALLAAAVAAEGLGPPAHVLVPNLSPEHWYHAADWAADCAPGAKLWVPPGLLEARSTAGLLDGQQRIRATVDAFGGRVGVLPTRGPLPGLEGEVEVATFVEGTGSFIESAVWLARHKAVYFADLAFAAYDHPVAPNPILGAGSQITGVLGRLGCPAVYLMMLKDRAVAQAWLDTVLRWRPERLLSGHLDPVVGSADMELRRCFGFLLEGQQAQA
ncbi:hypothetical protein HYH03_012602 [Edaphochlamys debaryana]|uniref:Uncharacterized protein n=1 Tax=Edaphochlamys debaryana TaxID=47281 RepID=A0A836BU72_9CHLO|nr:hypothetical protein HYH03_012602 [Edaphochlamys debaryana]|eukprot:KAG2488802.1 hypothetical protein HYH03_012602 [Edaphochlamys debaryana]